MRAWRSGRGSTGSPGTLGALGLSGALGPLLRQAQDRLRQAQGRPLRQAQGRLSGWVRLGPPKTAGRLTMNGRGWGTEGGRRGMGSAWDVFSRSGECVQSVGPMCSVLGPMCSVSGRMCSLWRGRCSVLGGARPLGSDGCEAE